MIQDSVDSVLPSGATAGGSPRDEDSAAAASVPGFAKETAGKPW
ncbi:MAG: hypothetical protein ACK47B_15875 [Armatimonadota bacterium]